MLKNRAGTFALLKIEKLIKMAVMSAKWKYA